jgi:hypothetical protein
LRLTMDCSFFMPRNNMVRCAHGQDLVTYKW